MFVVQALAIQTNLSINVLEFSDDPSLAWVDFSIVAYNASNETANCTFVWDKTSFTYVSNCSNAEDSITKITQIRMFDTVDFYNGSVYMYTLDNSTLANVGLTNDDLTAFFTFPSYPTGENQDLQFSFENTGFFVAQFATEISKVDLLVFTETMLENYTMHECDDAHFAFGIINNTAVGLKNYKLIGYQNEDRVFSQNFQFDQADPLIDSQQQEFFNVSIPVLPDENATSPIGNPISETIFLVNLTDFINQTDATKTSDSDSCEDVIIRVFSNDSQVAQIPNGGFCVVAIVSNTDLLVPFTDFIMNATFTSTGAIAFATKTRLTPRIISDWVENAMNAKNTVFVTLDEVNVSRITDGEIAAIVIGSFIGLVMIIIALVFFFRWCMFGMMAPVAAPKMMM